MYNLDMDMAEVEKILDDMDVEQNDQPINRATNQCPDCDDTDMVISRTNFWTCPDCGSGYSSIHNSLQGKV